jgi:hypothetical protein
VEARSPSPRRAHRFFAVTAFKFTNADGVSRYGRFRIRPEAGTEYLSDADAAAKSENFLFDELAQRLAKEPVGLGVFVADGGARVRRRQRQRDLAGRPHRDPLRDRHRDGPRGRPGTGVPHAAKADRRHPQAALT